MSGALIDIGEACALPSRKLREDTCEKWGYTVSKMGGQGVQIANYRDTTGKVIAQKVRFANKDFKFIGDAKNSGLYGQHLWRDGGKRIVITEGELDALSYSQATGNSWPVVSLPTGASGAKRAIEKSLQWLLTYDEVVLLFDNDAPGQTAASECSFLFPPGKCKIAKLPLKDAGEMLVAGKVKELANAVWEAKVHRPDGIVDIADVMERALQPTQMGLPWFSEALTHTMYGRRMGEIIMIGAGTGTGKTEFIAEQIYYDLMTLNMPVAVFLLEQQPHETVQRMASKQSGKLFHIPNREGEEPKWAVDDLRAAITAIKDRKLSMYDSFGATDWELIKNTIRFLAHSEGIQLFYLDHLTALAGAEDDERTGLERIMGEMASLVKELNITIHCVSHLSTPIGTPHEEGGRVMARHFKGSRAIGFWSHTMIGLERNQQEEDPTIRAQTTFRILKHRVAGHVVGETVTFAYDRETGRLNEAPTPSPF